ncbi:MAG: MFS transporter [Firmicutes bacterium]|nr:MFS transporter [Alicyclobacillaceae bacterium]MCL6497113.1 MFS transporter [Bacillota bacterium]
MMAESAPRESSGVSGDQLRALLGGWLTLLLGAYEAFLPLIVLPVALAYFEPPTLPAVVRVTLVNLVFALSVVASPVGGLLIGPLGDRVGRRRVLVITNVAYAVSAVIITILPGFKTWGYASIALLLFLRLATGAFATAGGGGVVVAFERSRQHLRGLIGGILGVSGTTAIILLSGLTAWITAVVPLPAYVAWAWHIPFYVGSALALVDLWVVSRIREVEYFTSHRPARRATLRQLVTPRYRRAFIQGLILYTGYFLTVDAVVGFMPSLLETFLHEPPSGVSTMVLLGNVAILVFGIAMGAISQRIGRRLALALGGAWILVVAIPLYYFLIRAAAGHAPFATVAALGVATSVFAVVPFSGMVITYLAERFPLNIRATAVSAIGGLGIVVPGFYTFYLLGLSHLLPYQYTVLVLVGIGGALTLGAMALGPETRHVDILAVEEAEAAPSAAVTEEPVS